MLPRIRKRFTYANIIATIALVFAMSGGAYAASRYIITSTKQISPKVLKALKGANGKNGAAGATGLAGATGATGSAGSTGSQGSKGENGQQGLKGETGSEGPEGPEGSPWTAGGTLPAGKSETGAWTFAGEGAEGEQKVAISFMIPLAATLAAADAHFVTKAEVTGKTVPAGCEGGSVADPVAKPGNLCVYESELTGALSSIPFVNPESASGGEGVGKSGTIVQFVGEETFAEAKGVWIVTAPN